MIKYFTIEDLLKHYLQKKFHILEDDLEELERFSDVDYEDEIADGSKTHWGEDSK